MNPEKKIQEASLQKEREREREREKKNDDTHSKRTLEGPSKPTGPRTAVLFQVKLGEGFFGECKTSASQVCVYVWVSSEIGKDDCFRCLDNHNPCNTPDKKNLKKNERKRKERWKQTSRNRRHFTLEKISKKNEELGIVKNSGVET